MRSCASAIAKRQLPRLAIDATPYSFQHTVSPSSTISSSSAQASGRTSVDTPYSAGIFQVLCLYDFEATDHDQLSFRRNEVLDIVQQENSGWWAALRQCDGSVGWIPSAYVDPISEQTAERLRTRGHKIHIQVNTERLNPPIPDERSPFGMGSPGDGIRGYEWMPLADTMKNLTHAVSPLRFPNDVLTSAVDSPLIVTDDERHYAYGQVLTIPDTAKIRAACPPSPSTPMPVPPLRISLNNGPRPAPIRSSLSQFPQSPTPTKSPATVIFARQFRRRPVLIEDSTSLSRLSTLFESLDVAEVDFLANSPVVTESIDAYSRVARASVDKVKQITGDDDAQALYNAKVAQIALPWFLKPEHGEGDIKVEYDGTVSYGTLPALVERLTVEHFSLAQEKEYRHAFLMTFPTFCSADNLFELLLSRYNISPPPGLEEDETDIWRQKKQRTSQRRVFATFVAWLQRHRLVEDTPPVAQRLQEFLESITGPTGNKVMAKQVMKVLERITFASSPGVQLEPLPSSNNRKRKSAREELLKMDATLIAEHLCLYEQRQQGSAVENLVSFCSTHDRLANWVKTSILGTENMGKRASIIDLWIKVAEKCRAVNALSSLSAIVAALTSTAITRLHMTWAHVEREARLVPLATFNDPQNGFRFPSYRALQSETDNPCVPFIGMYLTDLLHVHEHFPDNIVDEEKPRPDLINFTKRQRLSEVLDNILRHQENEYSFSGMEDLNLYAFIESHLQQAAEVDQAAIWKMSQEIHRNELIQADIRRGLEAAGF
ncbi:hypothetical protein EUX98_g4841 [Antrodiella citrinella]|uniref:Ras GEF n=1 Tax=Antrodiella citrinella TaxID=2447956 RepID=A0A4S4MUT0_9APHY|nr:hypothetical protein EUX98_g4841 [Antrodiella citrinella]